MHRHDRDESMAAKTRPQLTSLFGWLGPVLRGIERHVARTRGATASSRQNAEFRGPSTVTFLRRSSTW